MIEGKNAGPYSIGIIEGSSVIVLTLDEYEGLTKEQKFQHSQKVHKRYL